MSHAILGDLRISMVIVSSKVTSPKVLITVVIKMIMMIVMIVMIVITVIVVIYCVMNNFLLVMNFVDKMWEVHPDVYAENQNQE
jgi:hypothetical protein